MKRIARPFISILLSIVLLVSMAPANVMPAFASEPIMPFADPGTYNTGDVAAINTLINTYGLSLAPAPTDGSDSPAGWSGKVTWNTGRETESGSGIFINRRITGLNLSEMVWGGQDGAVVITGLSELNTLNLSANKLTDLTVSALGKLQTLNCYSNDLTALTLSGVPLLTYLNCSDNKLSSLDATGLSVLASFYCDKNLLTELLLPEKYWDDDDSGYVNPALVTVNCQDNRLETLDLSDRIIFNLNCSLNYMGPDSSIIDVTGTGVNWSLPAYTFEPQRSFNTYDIEAFNEIITHMGLVDGESAAIPTADDLDPMFGWTIPKAWWDIMDFTPFTIASQAPQRVSALNIAGMASGEFKTGWATTLPATWPDGKLDVKALDALTSLDVSGNGLLSIDVTGLSGLVSLDVSDNVLPSPAAVTGAGSIPEFIFDPQYYILTMDGGEITGVMDGGTGIPDPGSPFGSNYPGKGIYRQGTAVAITADEPQEPGDEFKNWTRTGGGTFANAGAEVTVFTMPKGYAAVTAVFGPETEYNESDVEIIKGIINDYDLDLTYDDPESWETAGVVTWSDPPSGMNKRVIGLDLNGRGLSPDAEPHPPAIFDATGLIMLKTLDISDNALTDIDISGLNLLTTLICSENLLEALDLTGLTALTAVDCSYNYLTGADPVTGPDGTAFSAWDDASFIYDPQYYALTLYRADSGSIAIDEGKEGKEGFFPADSEVRLTAGAAVMAGEAFSHWMSNDAEDPDNDVFSPNNNANPVTFTMPKKAVTVEARFATLFNIQDIIAMNAVIDSNPTLGITGWAKTEDIAGNMTSNPWPFVTWSNDNAGKRVTKIDVSGKDALGNGTLTVSGAAGLDALAALDVSGNKFTSLAVSSLAGLTALDCSDNMLAELTLSGLGELVALDASKNILAQGNISGLAGLAKLETLELSENLITTLNVSTLSALKTLDLTRNRIAAENSVYRPVGTTLLFVPQYYSLTISSGTAARSTPPGKDNNGMILDGGEGGTGWYLWETALTVKADGKTDGTGFASWTIPGSVTLTGGTTTSHETIKFDMPNANVSLTAAYAPLYHTGDIAVVNKVITDNGLGLTLCATEDGKYIPPDWTSNIITWSEATSGKRVTGLDLNRQGLTGMLDMGGATGLTELLALDCSDNELTGLDVTAMAKLAAVDAKDNLFTGNTLGVDLNIIGYGNTYAYQNHNFIYTPLNYILTLEGGAISGGDYSGLTRGKYRAGAVIGIAASTPEPGDDFKGWQRKTGSGGVFGNQNTTPTTFIMPANNVTIEAVFGPIGFSFHMPDVLLINSLIDNNRLNLQKYTSGDDPEVIWAGKVGWTKATSPYRINTLDLTGQALGRKMTGAVDLTGLSELVTLNVKGNDLTALTLPALKN